jgi:ParB family transcriptional regulator, chromosome partitioning protein
MMKIQKVRVDQIKVMERVREEYGDMETLKNSIRKYGLLNPVIIDTKFNLIAGAIRLRAAKELNFTEIDASIIDEATRLVQFDMEMQENLVRKDFTEEEIHKSIEMKKRLLRKPLFTRFLEWIKRIFRSIASIFRKK